MKTGLVLEGGAQRAIYTAGVLDVFMENGITFDGVIGVSAGAIHGCSFVSRQHRRSIDYTLAYAGDKNYMSWYSFLTTGNMVNEEFCYHTLPEKLFPFDHKTFEANNTDFYAVCSNLQTGQAEYVKCAKMDKTGLAYLRASASMPFVSRISEIGGKKYLDGGICDSIPLRAFQKMGYERCVVVQTRAAGYQKKPNKLGWLAPLVYRKYPKFAAAIKNRHIMYNNELEQIEQAKKNGAAFVIRPSKNVKIHHMETDKKVLQAVYDFGRGDAIKLLSELKKFLKEAKK